MNKNISKKRLPFFLCFLTVLSVLMLSYYFDVESSYVKHSQYEKLDIVGTYSYVDDSDEVLFDSYVQIPQKEIIRVKGNFNRNIPPNIQIMLRVDNIKVSMFINGEKAFSYGDSDKFYQKASGNVWTFFKSPGITTDDEIEIYLDNPYKESNNTPYETLLSNMYIGYEGEFLYNLLSQNGLRLFTAVVVASLGILLFIICIVLYIKKYKDVKKYFYVAGFAISAGVWLFIRFDILSFFSPYIYSNNLLDGICLFLTPLFFMAYIQCFLTGVCKNFIITMNYGYGLVFLIYLLFVLLGILDPYECRYAHILLVGIIAIITASLVCNQWFIKKDPNVKGVMFQVLLLCGGTIFDGILYYGFKVTVNLTFHICCLAFVVIELVRLSYNYMNSLERAARVEWIKSSLILSQIQPHFIFNTLNSISALCHISPQKADEAIMTLSKYLRESMNWIEQERPIEFAKELSHIDSYLEIEKIRFGDKLRVEYDIAEQNFILPPLTIQPLIENAIKHGIMQRPDGGLIRVTSMKEGNRIIISVSDDGVGFDVNKRENERIGLKNVRTRILLMGGEIFIKSKINMGTEVSIYLPVNQNKQWQGGSEIG